MRIVKNKELEVVYYYFNEEITINKTIELGNLVDNDIEILVDLNKDNEVFGIEVFCDNNRIREIIKEFTPEKNIRLALQEILDTVNY